MEGGVQGLVGVESGVVEVCDGVMRPVRVHVDQTSALLEPHRVGASRHCRCLGHVLAGQRYVACLAQQRDDACQQRLVRVSVLHDSVQNLYGLGSLVPLDVHGGQHQAAFHVVGLLLQQVGYGVSRRGLVALPDLYGRLSQDRL